MSDMDDKDDMHDPNDPNDPQDAAWQENPLDATLAELARDFHRPPPTPREAMWARIEAARAAERQTPPAHDPPPALTVERGAAAGPAHPARPARPGRRAVWVPWSAGIAALLALGIGIGRMWERARPSAGATAPTTVATAPATGASSATPSAAPSGARDSGATRELVRPETAPPRAGEQLASAAPARGGRRAGAERVSHREENEGTARGGDDRSGARTTAPGDVAQPFTTSTVSTAAGMSAAYRLTLAQHLSQSEAFLTLFRASVRSGRTERLAGATAEQLLGTNRLLLDSPAAANARTRRLLEDLELVLAQIAQLGGSARSDDIRLITDGLDQSDVLPRIRTAVPAGVGS